jgi:2'-5' RNA ligase
MNTLEVKRVFIAIKVYPDPGFKSFFREIRSNFGDEKIRWVNPQNFHLTLRFLGDTEVDILPNISRKLEDVARETNSFRITIRSIGVFRSISWPRVLWAGLEENRSLNELKERVDRKLELFGYPGQEKAFSPHLTIGRMKRLNDINNLRKIIGNYEGQTLHIQDVESMVFFESRLSEKGPEYFPINEYFFL